MTTAWTPVGAEAAPERTLVLAKRDASHNPRPETRLMRIGRLWWLPDGSDYIDYEPTHWRPLA